MQVCLLDLVSCAVGWLFAFPLHAYIASLLIPVLSVEDHAARRRKRRLSELTSTRMSSGAARVVQAAGHFGSSRRLQSSGPLCAGALFTSLSRRREVPDAGPPYAMLVNLRSGMRATQFLGMHAVIWSIPS